MTKTEAIVSIVAAIAGYWFVNACFPQAIKKPDPSAGDKADSEWNRTESGHEGQSSRTGERREEWFNERQQKKTRSDDEVPSNCSWYEILGVSEQASDNEISAAYKRKISMYHPDKVSKMGDEIRQVAEKISKDINAAYNAAMRRHR